MPPIIGCLGLRNIILLLKNKNFLAPKHCLVAPNYKSFCSEILLCCSKMIIYLLQNRFRALETLYSPNYFQQCITNGIKTFLKIKEFRHSRNASFIHFYHFKNLLLSPEMKQIIIKCYTVTTKILHLSDNFVISLNGFQWVKKWC